MALPLGLVGLAWLRLYLPLIAADLPQSAGNTRGPDRLGFAREGFRALMAGEVSELDLRVGAVFSGITATALHQALCDACATITAMPAHFMTYPGSASSILPVIKLRNADPREGLTIDAPRLWSYGEMRVPGALWRVLQRYAVWVEPSLIAEWIRLMRGYADRQGRRLNEGQIAVAMIWAAPERDVAVSRAISLRMIETGHQIRCVWTGADLSRANLDIDHAFPWAEWPCGDLWNLLPAHRQVNQHQKRDKLPSEALLRRSHDRILHWWNAAYLNRQDAVTGRFSEEAKASLPGLRGSGQDASLEEVFVAMGLQRFRLRFDQGVPEWSG